MSNVNRLIALAACTLPLFAQSTSPATQIDALMRELHARGQYDGAILVAQQGKVLYRGAFGLADERAARHFTPETQSCLASLSKPFTATAIMMLAEKKQLSYDDPIAKYFPELPKALGAATIRQMLNHTSGIPDYSSDLDAERPGMSATDVVKALQKVDKPLFSPGEKYEYSNSGYVLLGLIVEKVSGKPFLDFLRQSILDPLDMKNTIAQRTSAAAHGYGDFGGPSDAGSYVGADGGLYSTVDDLLKFDQAKLLSPGTLKDAFTAAKVRSGTTTYGLGWNITSDPSGALHVWHTGNTAGYRAYMEQVPSSHLTVIMLTNHGNTKRIDISAIIQNILAGKPYTLPKKSVARELHPIILKSGINAALTAYQTARSTSNYDLSEGELNSLGYQLLSESRPSDAVRIFALNTAEHPSSSNAFDSLAEAFQASGDKASAIRNYTLALEKDPGNLHAKTMLEKLKH